MTTLDQIRREELLSLLERAQLAPELANAIMSGQSNAVTLAEQPSAATLAETLSTKYSIARRKSIEVEGGDSLVAALHKEGDRPVFLLPFDFDGAGLLVLAGDLSRVIGCTVAGSQKQ